MIRHEPLSLGDARYAARPQPRSFVGPVNDPLECEADRAAASVVANENVAPITRNTGPAVARKAAGAGPVAQQGVAAANRAVAQGGAPLTPEQRAYFEPRFGHDFSDVRLHAGAEAAQAARGIGARAYTHGHDIALAHGRFDTRLLAHELTHVVQQRGGNETIQRQPDDSGKIEMPMQWAFAMDPQRATDIRYARTLGKADAKRLRKEGSLSAADRAEVNAKLSFFTGNAYDAYVGEVRLALIEVTREEIDMGADESAKTGQSVTTATGFERFRKEPTYIDNEISKVEYFTAELAIIHYRDGTKFELGLSAQWMKPPIVHVDYGTPAHELHAFTSSKGEARFFRESDEIPRSATFEEIRTKHSTEVKYYIEKGTARIVPSHINRLTAPTLCDVLLNSFRQYQQNVEMGVMIGYYGTIAIGSYAGAGGLPKNTGVGLGKAPALLPPLSRTARKLAGEMDSLLATGGTKTLTAEGVAFTRVEVSKQGTTLVVRRFESKLPEALRGKGIGMQAAREFEDAAVEVARLNGAKTVKVDVGIIVNPGWREVLEARGYVYVATEGAWIKTIKVE